MGSGKIKTENYYCGYKNIIFNPNLYLIICFSTIYFILVYYIHFMEQEIKKKKLQRILKSGFSLQKTFYEFILLSEWCMTSNHTIDYIHES